MAKVTVIVPARNERFLQPTVTDLLNKGEDIEIFVVLDGYWPDPPLIGDKRLKILHRGKPLGMRSAINDAAKLANGKYLMKTDAHCMFAEGYDKALVENCDDDWVVVPRRYRLDPENWCIKQDRPHPLDYQYVCFPDNPNDYGGPTLTGRDWPQKGTERKSILVDELLTWQGSCWFMPRDYFFKMGELENDKYGTFGKEPQEIGFKSWLGGGKLMVNKKTYYAHLHKGRKYGRGYSLSSGELTKGGKAINQWLVFKKAWDKQIYDIKWLIDKFAPVPGWDKCDWSDEWRKSLS
jgi:glycosyltransferase involved in cell wall biosynthesis